MDKDLTRDPSIWWCSHRKYLEPKVFSISLLFVQNNTPFHDLAYSKVNLTSDICITTGNIEFLLCISCAWTIWLPSMVRELAVFMRGEQWIWHTLNLARHLSQYLIFIDRFTSYGLDKWTTKWEKFGWTVNLKEWWSAAKKPTSNITGANEVQ